MQATKKRAAKLEAKGKPVDFKELLRMEPDGGTTNIRNVGSKHWARWLGTETRCVVPFTSFSEFNLILCRNVLIYFDHTLRGRVYKLFADSLASLGVLCLGRRESLRFTAAETEYEEFDPKERIYRRRR